MDTQFPFSFISPSRNYRCRFYSECLDKHVLRESESTSFDCIDCTYWEDTEDIDPDEGLRCLQLLAEIYRVHPAKLIRGMVAEERDQAQRHADCWRQAETEAAA